jgi:hypothetical protein
VKKSATASIRSESTVHDVVDARGADPSFVVATSRRYIANGYL